MREVVGSWCPRGSHKLPTNRSTHSQQLGQVLMNNGILISLWLIIASKKARHNALLKACLTARCTMKAASFCAQYRVISHLKKEKETA